MQKKLVHLFQNISIIFFSAAKSTKERKITEESVDAQTEDNEENDDSGTESIDSEEIDNPNALNDMQDDIELFKRQLGDLDKAVNNTANKIDAIQLALDKVMENLKLGKPIEPVSLESDISDTDNKESVDESESINKVSNSSEIFDRDRLLQVLKSKRVDNLKNPPRVTVGMIGYPNVGKSSSVNVLMQTKKVS